MELQGRQDFQALRRKKRKKAVAIALVLLLKGRKAYERRIGLNSFVFGQVGSEFSAKREPERFAEGPHSGATGGSILPSRPTEE
jgi:hypothetical protein